MSNKIVHFSAPSLSTVSDNSNKVVKKGLVLYEGTHIDSKKKVHRFSRDRIQEIVDNSNALFESGRIPVLKDHDKSQDSVIGDVESRFECIIIDDSNVPNATQNGIAGKMGIFVNDIAIKSKKAIQQVHEGLLNTISPGIDILTNTIREISATPTPAINHVTMFKRHDASFSEALTFDDLEQDDSEMEQIEQQFYELVGKLWQLTNNIHQMDEDEQGISCEELQMQVLQDFNDRFLSLIGMSEENEQEQNLKDPRILQSRGNNPNFQDGQRSLYSRSSAPVNAFSMAEMEQLNRAEFGMIDAAKNAFNRVGRDLSATGKSFTAGRKSALGQTARSVRRKPLTNQIARGSAGVASTGDHIRATGSGVASAAKKFFRTKTGKGTAIAGAGVAAVGAGVAGYKLLNRNKQK